MKRRFLFSRKSYHGKVRHHQPDDDNINSSLSGSQKSKNLKVLDNPLRHSANFEFTKDTIDSQLVAYHQSDTLAAEQYRKLYIEIVRANSEHQTRILLISSALEGEGKTTTAANLAITMAAGSNERDVLLIETDMRKPRLQTLFNAHPKAYFADFLLNGVDDSQIYCPTPISGLTAVYAGNRVKNPTALFTSEKIDHFFNTLRSQTKYRYIIIDSSPILLTPETSALVQHVDAVILVVKSRSTSGKAITQAIETIGADKVFGCILNNVKTSDNNDYQYYYQSSYSQTYESS